MPLRRFQDLRYRRRIVDLDGRCSVVEPADDPHGLLVVGKSEPERVFELLGRRGEVSPQRLELRDTFVVALADYREQHWGKAAKGWRDCLTIVPDDPASQVFLDRIAQFSAEPPGGSWNGVWALHAK